MHICLSKEQYRIIEEYARSMGMLNVSQAVEAIIDALAEE
jgi:hypothetical protein